jgi:deoxyribodipyrimidine photo-lyase
VLTQANKPFSVFTPYKNCLAEENHRVSRETLPRRPLCTRTGFDSGTAIAHAGQQLGFEASNLQQLNITPGMSGASQLLQDFLPRIGLYHQSRDFPGVKGVLLSVSASALWHHFHPPSRGPSVERHPASGRGGP